MRGGDSAWVRWMNGQYIRGRAFDDIYPNQGDSAGRKVIIRRGTKVWKCVSLGPQGRIEWRGAAGEQLSFKNIVTTIRH